MITVIKTVSAPKPPKAPIPKGNAKPPVPPKPPAIAGAGKSVLGAPKLSNPSAGYAGSSVLNLGSQLQKPAKPAATAPAAPAGPAPAPAPVPAPSTGGTASTAGNELDSTYYLNVAANDFKVNNAINSINLGISQAKNSLQTTLAQLAYQQPRDQLALEQKANAGGGLYSSVYDQNLGNLNYQYAGRQAAANTKYTNYYDTAQGKISGLKGSQALYDNGQAFNSAQRSTAAAQNNPAIAGLGGGAQPPPAPTTSGNPTFSQLTPTQKKLATSIAAAENAKSDKAQAKATAKLQAQKQRGR